LGREVPNKKTERRRQDSSPEVVILQPTKEGALTFGLIDLGIIPDPKNSLDP
jgi:hypothetical protein